MIKKALQTIQLLLCVLCLVSCAQVQIKEETHSEGTGNSCEVSFNAYTGEFSTLFLKEGDRIAVISPSTLPTREQTDAVIRGLKDWGYVPVEGKYVCVEERTLADCLEDLTWALQDPSIKAIFCVRGGYGASEVMDNLPVELISSSGKLIIGYSDITVYHSAWTAAGLPSVHASMSAAFTELTETCAEAEEKVLKGELPSYRCESGPFCKTGEAEGILIGGNLSTLTSVIDTAYDCTETDQPYILFFEDVEEDLQHIHRYLTVLKHQGVLDKAEGILFGEWIDLPVKTGDYEGDSRGGTFSSVADMISREFLNDLDIPVAFDFPAGHGEENYPLILGMKARLRVSEEEYSLSWE